jgi:hypothetical protein
MNTILLFCAVALVSMQASRQESPTLTDIVNANQSAIGLIHQIELTMNHETQFFLPSEPTREPDSWVWRWAKSGTAQRIRYRTKPSMRSDGLPEGIYDCFADEHEIRMLRNWDWDNPQDITPLNQGSVRAEISQRERSSPFVADPEKFLLWRFSFDVIGESWSLADLVRDSRVAELVGRADIDGHLVWHIRVIDPTASGTAMTGWGFEIFVDPSVNYQVRRVIEHHADVTQVIDGEEETFSLDVTRSVSAFRDFGDGVYVPVSTEFRIVASSSDRREQKTKTTVTDLTVNEPLSPNALAFRFPPNALVVYSPPETPTRQRVVLWGQDNQPAKEINSATDLPGFEEARRQSELTESGQPPTNVNWILILNGVGVILLGIVLVLRTFRTRSR